jgi:hypothetical protein
MTLWKRPSGEITQKKALDNLKMQIWKVINDAKIMLHCSIKIIVHN